MSQTKTAAVAAATVATFGYRVIVRATDANGVRKRFVTTVQSDEAGTEAHATAGKIAEDKAKEHGLDLGGLFYTVYPPVGLKCNGTLSKDWKQLSNGELERVKA